MISARHRLTRRLATVGTAALLPLTACSSAPTGSPSEAAISSPAESESATPSAEPTPTPQPSVSDSGRFARAAAVALPEAGVVRALTTSDMVLTLSGRALTARSLPAATVSWTLEPTTGALMDVLLDEDAGRGYLLSARPVPGTGAAVGRDVFTLRAFDLATGEVTAQARVRLTRSSALPAANALGRIRGDVGNIVVVDAAAAAGADSTHTALAVDLGRERLAWRRADTRVLAVTPRAVVVHEGTMAAPADVAGLAPRTGKQRWSALPSSREVNLVGATDSRVVLARSGPLGILAITSTDVRSGRTGDGVPIDTASYACRPASTAVAVCLLPGRRTVAWDVKRNKELWSLPTRKRHAPVVTLVGNGLVYGTVSDGWVALDARTGDDLESGPGPSPIAVNEFGGLFITGSTLSWVPDREYADQVAPTPPVSPEESPTGSTEPPDESPSESPG